VKIQTARAIANMCWSDKAAVEARHALMLEDSRRHERASHAGPSQIVDAGFLPHLVEWARDMSDATLQCQARASQRGLRKQ
jgi:hypothetical protein